MRYPEMALDYRKSGASILTFSSAFTVPTGKAHWHLLNRARAVENQCYVISAAQCGQNNERISTYGHSLIIDPWGEVLVDLEDEEGIGIAEISFERLDEVRAMVHMGR
jgi:predicted amidohydrolase